MYAQKVTPIEYESLSVPHDMESNDRLNDVALPGGQVAAMSRDATVSTKLLRGLVDVAERAGVSRDDFLRAANLDADTLESADSLVPRSRVYALCELAMDLSGEPALGLLWGETLAGVQSSLLSHLVAHAATLRQAFESFRKFHRLVSEQSTYRVVETADTVTVQCPRLPGESLRTQRFTAEVAMVGFFKLLRSVGHRGQPERVCFEYPEPCYHVHYARMFEGTASFDQPFTGIVFDRSLMDVRAPDGDEGIHNALLSVAERRMFELTRRVPYALRVRELLMNQGRPHRADMTSVARSLGLSMRSLRRRLTEEGTEFNEIAHEALGSVAKHLLVDMQRTNQEVAYELGFADTSSFYRAFKRWTGMTPSAFREMTLAGARQQQSLSRMADVG